MLTEINRALPCGYVYRYGTGLCPVPIRGANGSKKLGCDIKRGVLHMRTEDRCFARGSVQPTRAF